MAHYKHGRCRYQGGRRHQSEKSMRKRLGLSWDQKERITRYGWVIYDYADWDHPYWHRFYSKSPRWFRIMHHTRKLRAATRRLERSAVMDRHDPDNTVWPDKKKPVIYYW